MKGGGRGIEGQVKVGVGSGAGAEGVQRQSSRGGGDLAGSGIDTKRGRQLEGGNGDFKYLLCRLHYLP